MRATASASAPWREYESTAAGISESKALATSVATEGPGPPADAAYDAARNAQPARQRPR